MLKPIDWSEDTYQITDDTTMEISPHTGLSNAEVVKLVASEYEQQCDAEHFVYCFSYEVDGETRWYVGETSNLKKRLSSHSLDKNIDNIEVIEPAGSREEALEREREMSYEVAIDKESTEIYGGR